MTINAVHAKNDSMERRTYVAPKLVAYGSVEVLTKAGGSLTTEATPPACGSTPNSNKISIPACAPSDVRCKQNIVRVGTHSSGFGLYLYDYVDQFAERMGRGKFLGVMAQEVLEHRPDAVVLNDLGLYSVDYAALELITVH